MLRYSGSILTRILAIIVTCWFITHSVYLVDESYRTVLRLTWKVKYGDIDYKQVLTPEKMILLHTQPKSEYLGSLLNITGNKLWKEVETDLENSLIDMFQRTDKMKGWEIKKIGSDAWQSVSKKLKVLDKELESHSPYVNSKNQDEPDMKNILIYNRLSKSGSTWLMSLIYQLREQLGYLVVRGKYHSYRYFRDNDRKGLGHFLEQASTRARTMYIQHQFYINFTQFHIDQPRYVNMVRDPLEQFISWYYYKRTTVLFNRSPLNMTTEEKKILGQSLEECVVERRLECVYHGYTTPKNKTNQLDFRTKWNPDFFHPNDMMLHFCGHEPECTSLGNPLALARAKYNVENYFSVIGVLEYPEETAEVLENELPEYFKGIKQLMKEADVKNKNSIKARNMSAKVEEILRYRLSDLFELYSFIKQKLFKQFNKIKTKSKHF